MRTVSLNLPAGLDAKLTTLSKERRTTKSAVVREALESLFASPSNTGATSCLDLASDLSGILDGGAEDLSVNKDLMRGYGQ